MNNLTTETMDNHRPSQNDDSKLVRKQQVAEFVRTNADYYDQQFTRIGNDSRFV